MTTPGMHPWCAPGIECAHCAQWPEQRRLYWNLPRKLCARCGYLGPGVGGGPIVDLYGLRQCPECCWFLGVPLPLRVRFRRLVARASARVRRALGAAFR